MKYHAGRAGVFEISCGMEDREDAERLGWVRVYLETSLAGGAAMDLVVWSDETFDITVRSLRRKSFEKTLFHLPGMQLTAPPAALVEAFSKSAAALISVQHEAGANTASLDDLRKHWLEISSVQDLGQHDSST